MAFWNLEFFKIQKNEETPYFGIFLGGGRVLSLFASKLESLEASGRYLSSNWNSL